MMNLHGYARELAIDEMIDKRALIDKACHQWGLEDEGTIQLCLMDAKGVDYKSMLAYFRMHAHDLHCAAIGF